MLAHTYRIHHQYKTIKLLKDNLPKDHCIMHFDYSENWSCKYSKEITDVHLGASQQATLHDGLIYTNNGPTSFCTVSDSPRCQCCFRPHQTSYYIREEKKIHPHIKHIHCVTDSHHLNTRIIPCFTSWESFNKNFVQRLLGIILKLDMGRGQRMALVQPLKEKLTRWLPMVLTYQMQ